MSKYVLVRMTIARIHLVSNRVPGRFVEVAHRLPLSCSQVTASCCRGLKQASAYSPTQHELGNASGTLISAPPLQRVERASLKLYGRILVVVVSSCTADSPSISSGFHDDPWHSPQKADRSAKGLRSLADHRKNVTTTSTKRACHNRRRWSPCTSAEYLKGLLQQGQRPGCLKQLCDRVDQVGQLQVQKIPSAPGYPHMFAQARPKPLALLRSGTCLRNPKPQASWRHHGRGRYRRACVGSPVDLQATASQDFRCHTDTLTMLQHVFCTSAQLRFSLHATSTTTATASATAPAIAAGAATTTTTTTAAAEII